MSRQTRIRVLALMAVLAAGEAMAQAPATSFFADRRAVQTGDVLTVLITEFSTVAASAQTRTNKSEGVNASLLHRNGELDSVAADIDSNFAGGGQIERTGKLIAKLAVTVRGVDARGNLLIQGEQDIAVNNERQRISLA